ncbi:MAG TPA: polysaccharide deacetylase family protein, partial [Candidatus Limnocylindrales bacterium]|nr:polysaccharide deacetylase family protein [Candidatus Limnocylindrales bacterium]
KDTQLLDYLHTRVQTKNAPIEIANHGWNHEDFSKFNETTQSSLLNMTNQKVLAMFGVKPVTFLTPLNSLNNDTFKAVTENGMRYISSNAGNPNDRPPYPLSGVTLYHFPESAQTSTLTDQGIFVGTTHDYVFQQIQANLDRYGFAVVMVHPQDFALKVNKTYTSDMDWAQLGELRTLIDDIRAAGLKIVTINNINPDTTKSADNLGTRSVIPEWVKHVALFWEQAQITDKDFTQGIGYLIKQKIIILQNSNSTLSPGVQNPLQVKSNAGLWAYGQIPTEDFANGIKSLVENGIIVP